MSFDQSFLAPEADAYLQRVLALPAEARATLEAIEREARAENQPAVGRATGSLLRALCAGKTRVLEVGTNLGYSAIWMASAMADGGTLDTIEIDARICRRAREHAANAGVGQRVVVHEGAALDVLPRLAGPYEVIFLDAVKAEYPHYAEHALRLLAPGGLLAADNLLWYGRPWDDKARDADTLGVREYTRRMLSDPRFASTLVPVEDGLGISVRLH